MRRKGKGETDSGNKKGKEEIRITEEERGRTRKLKKKEIKKTNQMKKITKK